MHNNTTRRLIRVFTVLVVLAGVLFTNRHTCSGTNEAATTADRITAHIRANKTTSTANASAGTTDGATHAYSHPTHTHQYSQTCTHQHANFDPHAHPTSHIYQRSHPYIHTHGYPYSYARTY